VVKTWALGHGPGRLPGRQGCGPVVTPLPCLVGRAGCPQTRGLVARPSRLTVARLVRRQPQYITLTHAPAPLPAPHLDLRAIQMASLCLFLYTALCIQWMRRYGFRDSPTANKVRPDDKGAKGCGWAPPCDRVQGQGGTGLPCLTDGSGGWASWPLAGAPCCT
jgi:hypothetical protein